IKEKHHFQISNIIDFTQGEKEDLFLEGTGSMILDRVNGFIYASISKRTSEKLLLEYAKKINYEVISFKSYHSSLQQSPLIYHTNVMMCLASSFAVICLESILDQSERQKVTDKLKETEKAIIDITFDQMNNFAGNMLEVQNSIGDQFLVMSSTAYHSLNKNQINQIEQYVQILHSPIDTIETLGGGSARCMRAEIFLPNQG
ncbi:MAG: arginine deiminase-related protein, partial [Bacteroidota bacterium]|nr:arginine deiminase-related protein [Bacteroidota bacterium]